MSAHTPGPWAIHKHSSTAVVGSSGFVVAACGGFSSNTIDAGQLSEELEANTRLVAAAPDLLEALNNILVGMEASGGWEGDDELFNAGVAAYKKATGAKP